MTLIPEDNLELAFVRWSVVCQRWEELAAGHRPYLSAFLAGWMCRVCDTSLPEYLGQFKDSFLAGHKEACDLIEIQERNHVDSPV